MNPLMTHVVDPFHQWLLSLGPIGLVVWLVLLILGPFVTAVSKPSPCLE